MLEVLLIVLVIGGLLVAHQKRILMFMYRHVPDDTYKHFVLRLLAAMDNPDADETVGILTDGIHAITGTRTTRPIKYLFDERTTCPITMEDIVKGDDVIILTCGHMGKSEAMMQWLHDHNTCPICRKWTLTRS